MFSTKFKKIGYSFAEYTVFEKSKTAAKMADRYS